RRGHLAAVEARALARVAGGPGRFDERDDRVRVAVVAQALNALHVAGALALVPELLARAAPEVRLAGLARPLQRLLVHVGEREHLACAGVLDDAGDESVLVEGDVWVQAGKCMAGVGGWRVGGWRVGGWRLAVGCWRFTVLSRSRLRSAAPGC